MQNHLDDVYKMHTLNVRDIENNRVEKVQYTKTSVKEMLVQLYEYFTNTQGRDYSISKFRGTFHNDQIIGVYNNSELYASFKTALNQWIIQNLLTKQRQKSIFNITL